ncbi:MAG: hypothetical protein V4693_06865 [Pseudomonadota bacterium]
MNSTSRFTSWCSAIVAALVLAACAAPQEPGHRLHHPDSAAAPGASGGMAMMGTKDMQAMCEMHKKMMSAKTPAERQALMDERMKSMSPEMMEKHKAMMEHCR